MLRLLVSQKQTVLSLDPETTTEESSLYLTQFTVAACVRSLRFTLPSDTSHITTDLSAPHDTNSLKTVLLFLFFIITRKTNTYLLSQEPQTSITQSPWPAYVFKHSSLYGFHNFIFLSLPHVKQYSPSTKHRTMELITKQTRYYTI